MTQPNEQPKTFFSNILAWWKEITSTIGIITTLVGFIAALGKDVRLYLIIGGLVLTLPIFYKSITNIFTFGKDFRERWRIQKVNYISLVVSLFFIALYILPFTNPAREWVQQPSFAFPPAQPNETLLVIVDFDNRSSGKVGVDPAERIYNLINEKAPSDKTKFRLERYRQPVKDKSEARRILNLYGATILIWGWYDQIGAQPNIELNKNKISLRDPKLPESNLATPESFVMRFTEEMPAQAGYVAFFSLGMAQYQSRLNDVALIFFTQAIESANKTTPKAVNPWEALMWRDNIYWWSAEYDLAINDYSKALELYSHQEGFFNRGEAYREKREYDLAIADYNKAIEIDKNYIAAYINRGIVYSAQRKYDLAIADYNKAIEIDKNYMAAYINRGTAYSAQQKYDLAIADYNKALEIDKNYESAYLNRGADYYQQQKYDLAIADYNKALEIDKNFKEAYINRGVAYSAQQKYDLAIDDYSKALEIDKNFKEAYINRGAAYSAQQKYDLAIDDYSKAIEIDGNDKDVYLYRGERYRLSGKYTDALTDFMKVVKELDPTYATAYTNLGNTYADQRQFEKAISNYLTAVNLDPKEAYTYCALGITYTKINDFLSAIVSLDRGVQLDTKSEYPWCKTALDNARRGIPTK